eukprot:CAMPEP_0203772664 /NCGR_PEP_ID=MMETSP0099_2-20121227/4184_1 /ASSEMBLY_ACC=CAM_ASM_000209 /TAXON_ID=96639 /ORGANISM=" , Strain NY0313808BC1" /LENGTH=143 /DNA_ID=CAMNT_0050670321 /DNA_START=86 /DNA_END=517 /DNA_ORIENTATION=+
MQVGSRAAGQLDQLVNQIALVNQHQQALLCEVSKRRAELTETVTDEQLVQFARVLNHVPAYTKQAIILKKRMQSIETRVAVLQRKMETIVGCDKARKMEEVQRHRWEIEQDKQVLVPSPQVTTTTPTVRKKKKKKTRVAKLDS